MENVCVWRADARSAAWKDTRVARPETRPEGSFGEFFYCSWAGDSFAELKLLIAAEVPEGEIRDGAMERIEQHLDPTKTPEGEDEDELAKIWAAREREAPTPEAYEKVQARQWGELGCAAEGAPYVVHALIARLSGVDTSDRDQSDAAKSLASAFLDEAHCPGAHGISPADKADLKKIAAPAAPKAPKP